MAVSPGVTSGRPLPSAEPQRIAHRSGLASQWVGGRPRARLILAYSWAVIWWAEEVMSVPPLAHVWPLAVVGGAEQIELAALNVPPGITPLTCPAVPLPSKS